MAAGGLILTAGIAYLIWKVSAVEKKYLYISAGDGGTTEPSPGTYMHRYGDNVTIKALPNIGYTVGVWVVDGVEVARNVETITVTMDSNHSVIVTFWEGGVPPPTYPVAIVFPESPYYVSQKYVPGLDYVWDPLKGCVFGCLHLNCHPEKEGGETGYTEYAIKGKAVDAGGQGVPDIDVIVWSNLTPDQNKGTLLINDTIHLADNPIIVRTDKNGEFTVTVKYVTDMEWLCLQSCKIKPVNTPAKPCDLAPIPYSWISCAPYETTPIAYTVYANCVGTTVMGQGQLLAKAVLASLLY